MKTSSEAPAARAVEGFAASSDARPPPRSGQPGQNVPFPGVGKSARASRRLSREPEMASQRSRAPPRLPEIAAGFPRGISDSRKSRRESPVPFPAPGNHASTVEVPFPTPGNGTLGFLRASRLPDGTHFGRNRAFRRRFHPFSGFSLVLPPVSVPEARRGASQPPRHEPTPLSAKPRSRNSRYPAPWGRISRT